MAVYTTDQYIARLNSKRDEIIAEKKEIIFSVASVINQDKSERVFTRGLNADGRKIGEYSSEEIRISQKKAPRSLGGGKTRLFDSYKDFKIQQGRGGRVNLFLFGDLQRDFLTSLIYENGTWYEKLKREENFEKYDGLSEKYGKVFNFTKTEERKAKKQYQLLFLQILRK